MMTMKKGQPLRFFALLMFAWVGARVAAQYDLAAMMPARTTSRPPTYIAQAPALAIRRAAAAMSKTPTATYAVSGRAMLTAPSPTPAPTADPFLSAALPPMPGSAAAPRAHEADNMTMSEPTAVQFPVPQAPDRKASGGDRWHGSGWLLWRPGHAARADVATIGRLGGSQAGLRIDYALSPGSGHSPAAYARVTGALDDPAAPEGAVGLAIRPFPRLPFTIAVERRVRLGEGARNAMAVLAVGGFGPRRIAPGVEAEAYVQTGMVGFNRRDAFIDGKMSLLSPLPRTPLRVGAALSGGAQPGVERVDIGPEVQVRLPLPRAAARLSVEWRARIAGQAAPTSGLAMTLAADF